MKRIRYVSEFDAAVEPAFIDEIAAESERNNARVGITGMLVAAGGVFFQLIEGPDAAIDELVERIRADTRHHNMLLLSVESGDDLRRVCPDWAMRKADLSADSDVRLEPVRAIMRAIRSQWATLRELSGSLERVMWRELIDAEVETIRD